MSARLVLVLGTAGVPLFGAPASLSSALPVLTAPSASAATVPPSGNRPEYLAEQLRNDPVYISPSLARAARPGEVARLRRAVEAMPYPTFVVFAPSFDAEPGLEAFSELPTLLRDRVGRDGLYVVADARYAVEAGAYGVRPKGDVRRIGLLASDGVPIREGNLARLVFAVEHLRTGAPATRSVDAERAADEARPWWIFGGAALLGMFVPLAAVAMTPKAGNRRRARRAVAAAKRAAEGPSVIPVDRRVARQAAQEAVAGLARAIAEAATPADGALRRYDAASTVLSGRRATAVDYVGAETLAHAGQAALRGARWRPCFFDPRHGEGTRQTRWRRGADEASLPACPQCADDVDAGRAPRSLEDHGRPYWEHDGVWARTGFGAIDERVADVVLAGGRSV